MAEQMRVLVERCRSWLSIHPKVYMPFCAGLVAIAATWVETGQWNMTETKMLAVNAAYAFIGYMSPPRDGAKVVVLEGSPEDDDGKTTLGTPTEEYPPPRDRGDAPDA